ncbi:MAG: transglycosylase domain-containing protein [Myxococcota bacterium]
MLPFLLRGLCALCASFFFLGGWRSRLIDPDPTLLLTDREGRFLGELPDPAHDGNGYWPVETLPPRVVAATLALEDRRFRDHPGVDPVAVARAVVQNAKAGEVVSGASTLAMQVARMQDPGDRGLARKALEATTAIFLTARHGRDAVLAQYLRLAPYGNGIHGISYAARRYLDKPVEDLSWAETAFLCALPQAPSRTNPFRAEGKARAVARARRILDQLLAQGVVTPEDHALAQDELGRLLVPARGERPTSALHAVLWLEDALPRREIDPLVRTSLDLRVQTRVLATIDAAVLGWEGRGAGNAAVMVLDARTGEVVASVGSTGYFEAERAGAIDYTRVARNPGSTLKPFLFAAALDRGLLSPATVMDDLRRGPDGIGNADDAFLGPMLPRRALANSRNVPAVELLQRMGVGEGYALLRQLRLHDDALPASHYGLGLAVGGLPVTLADLARAYTALAGDGVLVEPSWRAGVAGRRGTRIVSEGAARTVAAWLADPMARLPSFPRMGAAEFPFPVAVKTGTSADFRDAWTVAWSAEWLVAVWVGDPGNVPMARLSGFSAAAEIAHDVLAGLQPADADGLADLSFPPPPGYRAARVCALSGRRAGEACDGVATEWFRPDEAPVEPCDTHVRRAVDVRTGALATDATPARFVALRTFVDLPARYAAWQAKKGLPRPPGSGDVAARAGEAPPVAVRVVSPRDGQALARDPDVPAELATVALEAVADPPVPQLVWYVDGEPWKVVDYPYTARWPVTGGEHRIEARVPFTRVASSSVRVMGR